MAKLTDKLFNRVIEGEMLPVVSFTTEEFEAGKVDEKLKHVHVGDLISYEGANIIVTYVDSTVISAFQLADDAVIYGYSFNIVQHELYTYEFINSENINREIQKITTTALTHSFAELDETLRGIVESAISDGSASCTEAQWAKIKELLDKSLYFNYEGVSMIKTFTDGINEYMFGGSDVYNDRAGNTLHVFHSIDRSELSIQFDQL